MMTFMGIEVYESPLCVRRVPVREHKEKFRTITCDTGLIRKLIAPRDRGNYHKRINKKWLKRYGTKEEHVIIAMRGARAIDQGKNCQQQAS